MAAIREIVVGIMCLCVAVAGMKLVIMFSKKTRAGYASESDKCFSEQKDALMVVPAICTVASIIPTAIFGICAFDNLTNIFAWVGMFEPAVYLAAKALGL